VDKVDFRNLQHSRYTSIIRRKPAITCIEQVERHWWMPQSEDIEIHVQLKNLVCLLEDQALQRRPLQGGEKDNQGRPMKTVERGKIGFR